MINSVVVATTTIGFIKYRTTTIVVVAIAGPSFLDFVHPG